MCGRVEGEGEGVLTNIMSHTEQRTYLQGDKTKRVEGSAERQFSEQKWVQIHLKKEVRNAPRVEVTAVKR